MAHLPRQQQQHLSSSPVTFCNSHAPLYEIYMRRFPGSGPGLSAPPCRVLPSAVGLLSMNIQRPPPLPPLSSSSSSALYVSPWLRLFLRSGFLSLSCTHIHSLSPSLFHCIHFCAFKKSSRITNQPEWQRRVKDYKRKQNEDGADHALFFFFIIFLLLPPIFPPFYLFFDSNMRAKPF